MLNKSVNAQKSVALNAGKVKKVSLDMANPELATEADIRKVFHAYCKSLSDLAASGISAEKGEFLNPMQFIAILRLVTGQKSNLYKEMQTFKKYVMFFAFYFKVQLCIIGLIPITMLLFQKMSLSMVGFHYQKKNNMGNICVKLRN